MSGTKTKALAELYPQLSQEELDKQRSLNEEIIEYEDIPDTPFRIAKKDNTFHLLMGNWKLTERGEYSKTALLIWMDDNKWKIIQRMIGCICYDFMKPLATIQGAMNHGVKINKPENVNQ